MASILKVDTIQDQAGNNIISEAANVITIGASGDTITVPAGATVSGFTSAGIDDNATSTAITIDSSENVGIGTSSPSSPNGATRFLHIGSSSDNYSSLVLEDNNNTWEIFQNNQLSFRDGTSTRMILDENGNVGIGTTSPGRQFEISSANPYLSLKSTDTSNGTSQIFFGDTSDDNVGRISYQHGNNAMLFLTSATEAMRIDSSGNVGIGTSSPGHKLEVSGNAKANNFTNRTSLQGIDATPDDANRFELGGGFLNLYRDDTAEVNQIQFGKNGTLAAAFSTGADYLAIKTNGDNERMRINSEGDVLIGTTSFSSGSKGKQFEINTNAIALRSGCSVTTLAYHQEFHNPNGFIGYISTSGSATSYNTSSDYRLKENVNYDFDATTRLKQLKPARFNFIADADTTVDGFIAHEVSSVVPEAITGEKDAVDENGNPEYQGIDQSKLVPLLVKTIQELEARITALETNQP